MQIDFIAEGWKPDLDKLEEWLNTRVFPIIIKDKKGKEHTKYIPGGLRPRRAYSFAFPKTSLDVVLNTLNPEDCKVSLHDGKGSQVLKIPLRIIRKLLRLKKLPKPDKSKGTFPMMSGILNNIRIIGLGYREDHDITRPDGSVQESI